MRPKIWSWCSWRHENSRLLIPCKWKSILSTMLTKFGFLSTMLTKFGPTLTWGKSSVSRIFTSQMQFHLNSQCFDRTHVRVASLMDRQDKIWLKTPSGKLLIRSLPTSPLLKNLLELGLTRPTLLSMTWLQSQAWCHKNNYNPPIIHYEPIQWYTVKFNLRLVHSTTLRVLWYSVTAYNMSIYPALASISTILLQTKMLKTISIATAYSTCKFRRINQRKQYFISFQIY